MIRLYSDGACSPNPGEGAWGCVIVYPSGQVAQHCGYISKNSTNNESELIAVYEGLRRIDPKTKTIVFTDSQYIVNSINNGWINTWVKRGWKTTRGEPIAHKELWTKIIAIVAARDVSFKWIKGHSGDKYNEMADKLANMALKIERSKNVLLTAVNQ